MAYAKLALLSPEYGLYTAFMGVLIYWFFATSKDITIGPVAVMSTIVGNVISTTQAIHPEIPGPLIAGSLAIICGAIIFFLGIARLGFIVEFISLTSVCAFITGSSFNIAIGQVPSLMGISSTYVNSRGPTYQVVIDTLKNLGQTRLDAAIGLTSLLMLYLIRGVCQYLSKKFPAKAKAFFFTSTLRTIFVILLYTLISWLVNKDVPHLHDTSVLIKNVKQPGSALARWGILGTVPRGFAHSGAPAIDKTVISAFADQIPASVIVLIIEHISISKSFGRINNYTINPSQELLAIGVTNLLGPFLGAYAATGSFSRTAIKSKAGVRTPLAGVITAIVVLIAIYALTAVFFYIPNAVLSAVIIHAVLDLITPANTLYQFWRISPLEVIIFLAGVLVTVFSSIENGIYTTVAVSAALFLFRAAKARGRFMGSVTVHSVVGDHAIDDKRDDDKKPSQAQARKGDLTVRQVFLPIDHNDGSNPDLAVQRPYPGVFIYRFSEGFNYPNASHYLDHLVQTIFQETRRTDPFTYGKKGDRPWNNPGPRKGQEDNLDYNKPSLRAIILDFSSVNNVDVTSVQNLIDVRNQLDRYAAPDAVEWHLASINNRWTKRALASAGFGYPTPASMHGEFHRWKPVFSVAEIGGGSSPAAAAEREANERKLRENDIEGGYPGASNYKEQENDLQRELTKHEASRFTIIHGINRPFFHIDLTSAIASVVSSLERKKTVGAQALEQPLQADHAKYSGNVHAKETEQNSSEGEASIHG